MLVGCNMAWRSDTSRFRMDYFDQPCDTEIHYYSSLVLFSSLGLLSHKGGYKSTNSHTCVPIFQACQKLLLFSLPPSQCHTQAPHTPAAVQQHALGVNHPQLPHQFPHQQILGLWKTRRDNQVKNHTVLLLLTYYNPLQFFLQGGT